MKGDAYAFDYDRPQSVGKMRAFYGNFGILVRAYTYIRAHGADGLPEISRNAVLNANYVMRSLQGDFDLAIDRTCMHECVLTAERLAKEYDVHALDIAKALLDHGFHAPTIYFPLPEVVPESIMIEPTESESKQTLDAFVAAMRSILQEAKDDPETLKKRPLTTPVRRLDEVTAARKPNLAWKSQAAD